jgi:hypothetical protein
MAGYSRLKLQESPHCNFNGGFIVGHMEIVCAKTNLPVSTCTYLSSQERKPLLEQTLCVLTQIDSINSKSLQALVAGLLRVLGRCVGLQGFAALDVTEFGGQEDLVSFASPLEPLAHQLFAVSIQAAPFISTISLLG